MRKCFLVLGFIVLLSGCGVSNTHNGVGSEPGELWFKPTGVSVHNYQDRIYNIVEDRNGYLYYCSDIEGSLELVLDKSGNPTKDIRIFER